MNFSAFVLLAACTLACAHASLIGLGGLGGAATLVGPANPGALLQGPSAKAAVAGPDGSLIVGGARGGILAAAPIAGGVVSAAVAPGVVGVPGLGLGLGLGHGLWGR